MQRRLVALVMAVASCAVLTAWAPPGASAASCYSFTPGKWIGSWKSSSFVLLKGTLDADLSVTQGRITGTVTVAGAPILSRASVTGTVSCNDVSLTAGLLTVTGRLTSAKSFDGSYRAGNDGGTLTAKAVRPIDMIALGDSYAAGVGVGAVAAGCDRDNLAYAPRAKTDLLPDTHYVKSWTFVACSGAVTGDLETKQYPSVASNHTVATITTGGNDIGFGGKVKGCIVGSCGKDVMALLADANGVAQSWDTIFSRLANAYVSVRSKMAKDGHLYVLTYPIPFARRSETDCGEFTATEQNAANALVTRLDDTIYKAVSWANDQLPKLAGRPGNVHFVDWRTGTREDGKNAYTIPTGYPGAGTKYATYKSPDGLCGAPGSNPFINGVSGALFVSANPLKALGNSFHPKTNGYYKAAELLTAAIRTYQG